MVAERETLLEFTVRVVAEPETLAEITAGWSQMVTKPRKCIGFLNTPQKPQKRRKPTKNTDTTNKYTPAGSYTPALARGFVLWLLALKTKARVKMR